MMQTNVLRSSLAAAVLAMAGMHTYAATTVTIATVNNNDMIIMQRLSKQFEAANPDIKLDWVVLEENVLRQRVTTDIATKSGQFDVLTIGTYEAPIWAKQGWLAEVTGLPADYDLGDVLKPVRDGLSYQGKLYALPFYAESSMLFYRKDLVEKAGMTMPEQPTYDDVAKLAEKMTDKAAGVYGICLRGKPGWGENMAFLSTLINTYGGQWFDEKWNPTIDSPEWKKAVGFYIDLMKKYGPPGAASNGFNENLALFASGKCGMWIDATSAAGKLYSKTESQVADKTGFARAPVAVTPKGSHWLWSWALAIPATSKAQPEAKKFIAWATSKPYIELVGKEVGWASAPPGTRASTYANPHYVSGAPFGEFVLKSISEANPNDATLKKVPYTGVQYVGIPEFQSIGTQVGQAVAGALAGTTSLDDALKVGQAAATRAMRQAGYLK